MCFHYPLATRVPPSSPTRSCLSGSVAPTTKGASWSFLSRRAGAPPPVAEVSIPLAERNCPPPWRGRRLRSCISSGSVPASAAGTSCLNGSREKSFNFDSFAHIDLAILSLEVCKQTLLFSLSSSGRPMYVRIVNVPLLRYISFSHVLLVTNSKIMVEFFSTCRPS